MNTNIFSLCHIPTHLCILAISCTSLSTNYNTANYAKFHSEQSYKIVDQKRN